MQRKCKSKYSTSRSTYSLSQFCTMSTAPRGPNLNLSSHVSIQLISLKTPTIQHNNLLIFYSHIKSFPIPHIYNTLSIYLYTLYTSCTATYTHSVVREQHPLFYANKTFFRLFFYSAVLNCALLRGREGCECPNFLE